MFKYEVFILWKNKYKLEHKQQQYFYEGFTEEKLVWGWVLLIKTPAVIPPLPIGEYIWPGRIGFATILIVEKKIL